MKKVVVISSTPRKNGNSYLLSKEFARGASESGHDVEFINLCDYNISYCIGCYACHKTGKCFKDDGMNELGEKLVNADVICFATPVYFYSMSGQLKVFIDRLVPYYEKVRADVYMIATMWDSENAMMENTFEAIRGLTRDCFEECKEKGVLFGSGLDEEGAVNERSDYLLSAYNMGKNC